MNKILLKEINRYREIVGLVPIVEQTSTGAKIYRLSGWLLAVSNNKLFSGEMPEGTYDFRPTKELGGQLSDFTVNPINKNILNSSFKNNVNWTAGHWRDLTRVTDSLPMQTSGVDYAFVGITPGGDDLYASENADEVGVPRVYTARVRFEHETEAQTRVVIEKYREEGFLEDGLTPYNYIRVNRRGKPRKRGKFIYWMELYPAMRGGTSYGKPTEPEKQEPITLSLDLTDVFVFDTTEFSDKESAYKKMDDLANQIEQAMGTLNLSNRIDFANKISNTPILGYASIDRNPEDDDIGKLPACQSEKNNGDYNRCLSNERAKVVADYLNNKFKNNRYINFKYRGMGGTKKFNNIGWPDSTSPDQTADNRRVVFNTGEITFR